MEHDSSIMNEGRTSEIREEKQKENKRLIPENFWSIIIGVRKLNFFPNHYVNGKQTKPTQKKAREYQIKSGASVMISVLAQNPFGVE